MIKPTVGRVVWYWPQVGQAPGEAGEGISVPTRLEVRNRYTDVMPPDGMKDAFGQDIKQVEVFVPEHPLAAIVTWVWDERKVNLAVFDHNGGIHARQSVVLVQPGDPKPDQCYCEWMPYQIGQAAKADAA